MTLTVFDKVNVFVPVETVADVPLMLEGAVAVPEGTMTGEYACPDGAVYVPLPLTFNWSIIVLDPPEPVPWVRVPSDV